MKKQTLQSIIRTLELVASDDETRYHLNHCEITKDTIRATDGHILNSINHGDAFFKNLKTPLYVHRDHVPFLKQALKGLKHYLEVHSAVLVDGTLKIDGKVISNTEDLIYPNLKQLIPQYTETVKIGIDADLLLSLVKSLRDDKGTKCSLEFKFETVKNKDDQVIGYKVGTSEPMIVKVRCNDSFGIIMPVRV